MAALLFFFSTANLHLSAESFFITFLGLPCSRREGNSRDLVEPLVFHAPAMVEMDRTNGNTSPELMPFHSASQGASSSSPPVLSQVMETLQLHIGKRISVISKTDNRFEGVLREVDASQATLVIVRVRFCGTENRQPEKSIAARPELYENVKFRLTQVKDIFAHVEMFSDMKEDTMVVECAMAVIPILWSNPNPEDSFFPAEALDEEIGELVTAEDWNAVQVDKEAALKMLAAQAGSRNKISIISKSLIRYEGILKVLDTESTQVSLVYVRFLGTENRPAVKKAEARQETYPSVKFQLAEARDIKAFIKMCAEMVNDHAIIPDESSDGFLSAPRKRTLPAPAPPIAPPSSSKVHRNGLPAKQKAEFITGVNGAMQIRLPESPSKEPYVLDVSQRAAAAASAYGHSDRKGYGRGSHSQTSSSTESPLATHSEMALGDETPVAAATGRARKNNGKFEATLTAGKSRKSRAASADASSPNVRSNGVGGTGTKKRQTSKATGGSRSPKAKKMKRSSAGTGRTKGKGKGKRSSSNGGVGGQFALLENGSEAESGAGVSAGGAHYYLLTMDETNQKFPCPIEDCVGYLANNLKNMHNHFNRTHRETHRQTDFAMKCHKCDESGFTRLPDLKDHLRKSHPEDSIALTRGETDNEEAEEEGETAEEEEEEEGGEEVEEEEDNITADTADLLMSD
ncbi:hypothetical protein BV898_09752 [Hypsibius exemplaris]|uniref:C2H2-type domain-containing protein n=1 Tax=Hypsibius exemplaris TaxID=2072580 RepID=A0A1W0WLM5_HYPEX|nr:hypothetical protein BV898_09752 [Hypsibius exemplaris]